MRRFSVIAVWAIVSYALHFPLRLFEDFVMGEMEQEMARNWQSVLGFFITWILPFLIVGVAIYFGYSLRKPKPIRKHSGGKGANYYSGYVDIGKVRAGANLKVVAKVGDYTSGTVTTNSAGYYNSLEVKPPNASYKGLPIEFYVEDVKVAKTEDYMGGGHGPNIWNLEYEPEIKDNRELGEGIPESEQHNLAVGKHRVRIVELLNIWKEQLSLMIKRSELDDFVANIERDSEFRAILRHCPSVNKKYNELGLNRALCKAKLNPISVVNGEEIKHRASKQEVAEDKRWLNGKMQSVVEAIEDSLKSYEYTKTKCDWCPEDMR